MIIWLLAKEMTMEKAIYFLIGFGCIIGFAIAQILLMFFRDEIFAFIDKLVEKVRKFFH